jgi:triosephosphate isomerase
MRTPIMAGNWKMYKTITEAVDFVAQVKGQIAAYDGVERVICAPFTALSALAEAIKGTPLQLGAQNLYWEDQGAFTGEVSPVMLKELCQYVIVGHSERRQFFGETDETVNKKIKAALARGLTPIVCVGESLDQNRAGETEVFVGGQARAAFAGFSAEQAAQTVIAYEPIWAIGTGISATPEDANRIIGGVVRATVKTLYGDSTAQAMRILYGGSVKPDNVDDLMAQPEIDGGLVGGASLKPADYLMLVASASRHATM